MEMFLFGREKQLVNPAKMLNFFAPQYPATNAQKTGERRAEKEAKMERKRKNEIQRWTILRLRPESKCCYCVATHLSYNAYLFYS